MKRINVCLLGIGLTATFNGLSLAETDSSTRLNDIVVTASRVGEKRSGVPVSVTQISAQEIEQSGVTDLGQLLAERPFGHIQRYPGASTSVGLRGFRTEAHGNDLQGQVILLIDGRRAGTGNAGKIPIENVESIEVIKGPAAVQYGSAAIGGVINVISKRGKEEGDYAFETVYGSFDFFESALSVSQIYGKTDISASFTYREQGDYETGDGDTYENSDYRQNAFSLNMGYRPNADNRFGLVLHLFDGEEGSPGNLSQVDTDDYNEKMNGSIDFLYEGESKANHLRWMARLFAGKDKDRWVDPIGSNPDGWDDGLGYRRETDQLGSQAQLTYDDNQHMLALGADWVDYTVEASSTPKASTYNNPAVFLIARERLFDSRLTLSGGARYDYYEVEVTEPAGRKEDDNHISPSVGATYMLSDAVLLRASYAEAFVMPSADQLAADYFDFGGRQLGNPDLDPETGATREFGIEYAASDLEAALTYFHTEYEDKIQATTSADGVMTWENVGRAIVEGIELDLSCNVNAFTGLSGELRPYVNGVYHTRYEDRDSDEDLQYISDYQLAYGLQYRNLRGTAASLGVTYTGKQNITDYVSGWPYNEIEKGSFSVVDLNLTHELPGLVGLDAVTLKAGVRNLLDETYGYVKGYPMPGRSFYLGLTMRL